MKVLKNILPVLLILAICAPFHLSELIITQQKKKIKSDVKKMMVSEMDKSELTRLEFDMQTVMHSLKWEHSHEFKYQGVMYDIMYRKYENGKVVYHCWKDKVETALNSRLHDLSLIAFSKDEKQKNQTELLSSYVSSLFHEYSHINIPSATFAYKDCTVSYVKFLSEQSTQVPTPPPCV